jgi:hypothetical protein
VAVDQVLFNAWGKYAKFVCFLIADRALGGSAMSSKARFTSVLIGAMSLILLSGCFWDDPPEVNQPSSPAAQQNPATAAQNVVSKLQPIDQDDDYKKLITAYRPQGMYIQLRVQSTGFDPNNRQQFQCADTSFWHFLKNVAIVTNHTFTLDVDFTINGNTLKSYPLLVLSDVNGQCKYAAIDSKIVMPPTAVGGDSLVGITYHIHTTDSADFTLFDTLTPIVNDAANLASYTKLVSFMSKPLLQATTKEFSAQVTKASMEDVTGDVSGDFDFRKKAGVTFSPGGFGGTPIQISVKAEPVLSVYTPKTIRDGVDMRPNYETSGAYFEVPGIYAQQLLGADQPTKMTADQHFTNMPGAAALLAALQNAHPQDFPQRCLKVKEELVNVLGLAQDDELQIFYEILHLYTNWLTDPKFRMSGCVLENEVAEMRKIGLSVPDTPAAASDQFALMNTLLGQFSTTLKYGTADSIKALLTAHVSPQVNIVDPAGILGAPALTKDGFIVALITHKMTNLGCNIRQDIDFPGKVTALGLGGVNGAPFSFTVEANAIEVGSAISAVVLNEIDVLPMAKDDPDAVDLVKSIIANGPLSSQCKNLLSASFKDFSGVAVAVTAN